MFFINYIIKIIPTYLKNYKLFRIQVFKILASKKSSLVESIGYFDTNPKLKIITIKSDKLGS